MPPLLAAAIADDLPSWAQLLIQGGIAAVVLIYFGRVLVPKLLEMQLSALAAFRDEMKTEREQNSREREAQRSHDEARTAAVLARLDALTVAVSSGSGCRSDGRRFTDARAPGT